MCCNWTVKFFELNANHSWQAAHLLLQNQKPYLFCFFHSTMCILLNNHGYSLVCKYINVCLINDYVIVLFFEQIKMLYILYNEFTWFFSSSKIRTLLWHYKVLTKCIQYYSGFLFFWNGQVHKDIWSLNLMVMIMIMWWWWWWSLSLST